MTATKTEPVRGGHSTVWVGEDGVIRVQMDAGSKTSYPTRLYTDETEALGWLADFLS